MSGDNSSQIVWEQQKAKARKWDHLVQALVWGSRAFDGPPEHVVYSLFRWRYRLEFICSAEGIPRPADDIEDLLRDLVETLDCQRGTGKVLAFSRRQAPHARDEIPTS